MTNVEPTADNRAVYKGKCSAVFGRVTQVIGHTALGQFTVEGYPFCPLAGDVNCVPNMFRTHPAPRCAVTTARGTLASVKQFRLSGHDEYSVLLAKSPKSGPVRREGRGTGWGNSVEECDPDLTLILCSFS